MANADIRQLEMDGKVFYPQTDIHGLVNNGAYAIDDEPTQDSSNLITSDSVYRIKSETLQENREMVNSIMEDYAPVEIHGDVTNVADEEDLTSVNVSGTDVLKFKDKVYNQLVYSGLGRKILRKNMVSSVNTLTQSMVNDANTIYIIQYDYELGENITIPANCILEFDGGSISGEHTLTGNNTKVVAPQNSKIFHTIDISGTWNVPTVYVDWFDVSEVVGFDNTPIITNAFNLASDNIQNTIIFPDKTLYVTEHTVHHTSEPEKLYLFKIPSNTNIVLNSIIRLNATDSGWYNIFDTYCGNNINITGWGSIIGDVEDHTGSEGDFGVGIAVSGTNINISNITVSKCWGDGIEIFSQDYSNILPTNIKITNVTLDSNRRNGIALDLGENIEISFCKIFNTGIIRGTFPKTGIDFEPFSYTYPLPQILKNYSIHNNVFNGNAVRDIQIGGDHMNTGCVFKDVHIFNNISDKEILEFGGCEGLYIDNENISILKFQKPYTNGCTDVTINSSLITKIEFIDASAINNVYFNNCSITEVELQATETAENVYFDNCNFTYDDTTRGILHNHLDWSGQGVYRDSWKNIWFDNCTFKIGTTSNSTIPISNPKVESTEYFKNCHFICTDGEKVIEFFGASLFDGCIFEKCRVKYYLYNTDSKIVIRNNTFKYGAHNVGFRIYDSSDSILVAGSSFDFYNNSYVHINIPGYEDIEIFIDSSVAYSDNCTFMIFNNTCLGTGCWSKESIYEGSRNLNIQSFSNKKLNGKSKHPNIGEMYFDESLGKSICWDGSTWVDALGNCPDPSPRVVLPKNMVSGVNTLTQAMINTANKIYVVQYDFTLGEDITIPANCVLEFDGGSISGTNKFIDNINNCVFNGDNWLDNSVTILNQNFFKLSWLKGSDYSSFINKYNNETTFEVDKNIEISSGISLTNLAGVSIVSNHKTIKRVTNFFNMITISNSSNITLKGFIIDGNRGDKNLDSGSEYRFAGIYLDNCNNTVIDNLEINNTLNNENNQSVIWVNNSNFTSILNSSFKGTEGSIIFFINGCTHAIVSGCVARLKLGSFITGTVIFGIFTNNDIVGNNSDSLSHSAISMNGDKNTAENNIIENISGAGINIAHSGMIYDISVSGNIIKDCRLGGIYIMSATNVNISNNTIDNRYSDNTDPNRFPGIRSQVGNEIRIFNNNIKAKYYAIHFEHSNSSVVNTDGRLVFIENNRLITTDAVTLLYKLPSNPIMIKNNIFDGSGGYCSNTWAYAKYIGNIFRGETPAIAQTTRRAMIENNVFENTGSNISLNLDATYVSRNNEGNIVNITDNPAIDSNWIWATNS